MTAAELIEAAGLPLPPYVEFIDIDDVWPKAWRRRAGVQRKAFARAHRERGVPGPLVYVRTMRVARGMLAMEQGADTTRAAAIAGFSDPFTFSNACKSLLGGRPRQIVDTWRDRVRQLAAA